jgi:hypothetical protein
MIIVSSKVTAKGSHCLTSKHIIYYSSKYYRYKWVPTLKSWGEAIQKQARLRSIYRSTDQKFPSEAETFCTIIMPTTYHIVHTNGAPPMRDASARRDSTTRRESTPGTSHVRRESSVPRRESTLRDSSANRVIDGSGSHNKDGSSSRREGSSNRIDGGDMRRDASRSKQHILEHSPPSNPQLMLHDPVDGPWQRAKDEWKDTHSWFAIDDCGRLLDVPHTFGSKRTIYKWIFFAWMMATIIFLWSTAENAWFLGDVAHWALIVSMIYQTLSLGNGHFQPPQPAMADGVNGYVKFFWIIFEVAAHLQLLSTFMFWVVVYPQQHSSLPVDYGMFALHGLVLIVVWIDGMLLNRIPVRVKHYFFVLAVDTLYVIWTVIQEAAEIGPTTVEDTSRTNTDAVYITLDWSNDTAQSVFLMIAMLTVIAPLLFTFQYCMSLYTFPWTWNGSKSRKVIEFDMCMSANINMSRRHPSSPGGHHGTPPAQAAAPPKKKKNPQQPQEQEHGSKPQNSSQSESIRSIRADQTLPLEIVPNKQKAQKGKKPRGLLSSAKSTDASVLTSDFDDDFVAPPPPRPPQKRKKKKPAAKPAAKPHGSNPKPKRQKSQKSLMDIA